MSTNELEMKIRELRQLQQLIEEAQAEAEDIRDASLPDYRVPAGQLASGVDAFPVHSFVLHVYFQIKGRISHEA